MMDPPGAPCAAVPGTTLTVEDLFYNVLTRKRALGKASEEYARVLDVVRVCLSQRTRSLSHRRLRPHRSHGQAPVSSSTPPPYGRRGMRGSRKVNRHLCGTRAGCSCP
jgi:DNA mismatch repair protein MLH1